MAAGAANALAITAAQSSPWAREKGEIFLSTRATHFIAQADEPFDPAALAPSRFERLSSEAYAEFGLTRTLSIGGKLVYGASTFFDGEVAATASGLSEIEGFLQYEAIRNARGALSVKLSGAAPTRFRTGARPALVSDNADAEIRVLYGRNLIIRPFKVFAAVEAGYRRRFGAAADQMRADALIGIQPFRRVLILVEAFSTTSLRNEAAGGADYDVVKIQPSAVWRISKRISLQAGMRHEIAGRNLMLGQSYFFGFWSVF